MQRLAEEEEQRRLEEEAQRENEDTSAAVDSSAEVDSSAAEEQEVTEESFVEHQYNLSEIPINLEYNARQLLDQLMMRDILIGRNFYLHEADDRQTQENIDVPTFCIWPCAMCVIPAINCGQDPTHWQPSSY